MYGPKARERDFSVDQKKKEISQKSSKTNMFI